MEWSSCSWQNVIWSQCVNLSFHKMFSNLTSLTKIMSIIHLHNGQLLESRIISVWLQSCLYNINEQINQKIFDIFISLFCHPLLVWILLSPLQTLSFVYPCDFFAPKISKHERKKFFVVIELQIQWDNAINAYLYVSAASKTQNLCTCCIWTMTFVWPWMSRDE